METLAAEDLTSPQESARVNAAIAAKHWQQATEAKAAGDRRGWVTKARLAQKYWKTAQEQLGKIDSLDF